MNEKVWSINGEDYFDDWSEFINHVDEIEFIENKDKDGFVFDMEYFEGDKIALQAKEYIHIHNVNSLLEHCDEWVYDDVGDIAEDGNFWNANKEAKEELVEIIKTWAGKHINLPYWKVKNVVKKKFNLEDLE